MSKPRKTIRCIEDLMCIAGGTIQLSGLLGLHTSTVENWRRTGVPLKHWPEIEKHYNVSPAELYYITMGARKSVTAPSRTN